MKDNFEIFRDKQILSDSYGLKSLFLVIEECSDFGSCSATCGGGTKTCANSCLNGNFGDDGCPIEQAEKSETCNVQDCPSLITMITWLSKTFF